MKGKHVMRAQRSEILRKRPCFAHPAITHRRNLRCRFEPSSIKPMWLVFICALSGIPPFYVITAPAGSLPIEIPVLYCRRRLRPSSTFWNPCACASIFILVF